MKCKVSMRFNKEVDFKKVSIHVGNFAVTADGQKFFFDFKKKNFQYVYDVVYEDDTVFVLYEGEELDLEKYPDSLSLIRKLDKITKLEACDISADDATIYPVGVFGFVIESPYFYSENSTDYIECRSIDPDSPKKGFKIELLSDALMGYNNMLTIKNLINKANATYQDAKEKEYAVDGDTILAKQITSINNDGYFSSYIFKVNGKLYNTTQCNKNHLFNTANTKVGDKKFITIDKKKPQNIIPLENRDDATYAPRVIFAFSFILLILSILGCIMDFIRKIKENIPTD